MIEPIGFLLLILILILYFNVDADEHDRWYP